MTALDLDRLYRRKIPLDSRVEKTVGFVLEGLNQNGIIKEAPVKPLVGRTITRSRQPELVVIDFIFEDPPGFERRVGGIRVETGVLHL